MSNKGDTCMHDNSWYSECAECDAFDIIDTMLDIVATTPNDMELGGKVRAFAEEISEIDYPTQMDLFDSGNTNQLNLFD